MTSKEFIPRPYQPLMTNHILKHKRCGLFCPMGLGKSSATLAALLALQLVEEGPILVIAPKRVAEFTWPDEVSKWTQFSKAFTVVPIIGYAPTRKEALSKVLRTENVIATINYENLPWLLEELTERNITWPFRTVVPDEASKLKGFRLKQGTKRARALAAVAHKHIDRIILLTGTPSSNGLQDLYGQLWFIDNGQRLGRTYSAFTQRWFRPNFNGFGVEPLPFAHEEIHKRISDVCMSLNAKDWFDLKEPVKNVIEVQLPIKARALYKDMENKFFAEIDGNEIEALNAAAKSMKCLQFCSGAAYTDGGTTPWVEVHEAKLEALESVIDEANSMPVLVFYHFKSALDRLRKRFPEALDLSTKEGLAGAKKGKGNVWLGHPASMGHGIDGLQWHTNICVFFDLNWNLEEHLQAIERIGPTRQAQSGFDRPVFVHLLIARDTMDEIVLQRIETKRSVQDILLESLNKRRAA